MQQSTLVEFASQVIFVHGANAEAEAAQQAALCERVGKTKTAETWHRVEAVIGSLRTKPRLN
jgi:hypothetical protein